MLIGVNTTPHVKLNPVDAASLQAATRRIGESNISYFRIPLVWSQSQSYKNGRPLWDDEATAQIEEALSSLPLGAQVLGLLTSPPPYVASQYFRDQSTLEGFFCRFVEGCIERFPRVNDWEVWNEPNASDFYLSVSQDGVGHRPWTAREFLHHAAIPGARTIRRLAPHAKICLAGVAEDGIVGHPEKKACLSNRLPKREPFVSMLSQEPHGQFYFIPDFLPSLVHELKAFWDATTGDKLFDAIAFHPYPYHGIYKTMEMDLTARSIRLVESFVSAACALSPHTPEIWITEVGCRSLDVPARNLWNEDRQCEFALDFFRSPSVEGRITRAYWYKMLDATWDLRQEKTFGLLDHYGNPKKAYYALQRLAVEGSGNGLFVLVDDFRYALKHTRWAVNENLFTLEAKSNFGFAIPSMDHSGVPELMLSPGREPGDWIRITGKHPLRVSEHSQLEFFLELSKAHPGMRGLETVLELVDHETGSRVIGMTIGADHDERVVVTPMPVSGAKPLTPAGVATSDVASLSVRLSSHCCEMDISSRSALQTITLPMAPMPVPDKVVVRLSFVKRSPKREMLRLARIDLRVVEEPTGERIKDVSHSLPRQSSVRMTR